MENLNDKNQGSSKTATQEADAAQQAAKQKAPRVKNSDIALQVTADSIANQKELYEKHAGRGTWPGNHTALTELAERAVTGRGLRTRQADALAVKTYYQIDTLSYRIAQELFVAPEHVVVPGDLRATVATQDPAVISKFDDPGAHSFVGLLYTRVTDGLSTKMGWIEERKRTGREVITDCNTPNVVALAKYTSECLRPLGNRGPSRANSIVLVVDPATPITQERYKPIFKELGITPPSDVTGTIWYTRNSVAAARRDTSVVPPQRIVQCFTNSFDALRKTHEEANQYRQEKSGLATLQNEWRHFADATLKGWVSVETLRKRVEAAPTELAEAKAREEAATVNKAITDVYQALIEKSLKHFEGSFHKEKKAVLNRLVDMKAKFERSPTGRINPNPLALRAGANDALQQLRAEDIRVKESYNSNDQGLIQERIKKDCEILRNTALGLRGNSPRLTGNERVFTDTQLSERERAHEIRQVLGKLDISPQALREIRLRPFTAYRDRILVCLERFESHLVPGHYRQAKESLAEMFLVCKVFGAQRTVEELKVSVVRSDSDISTELEKARTRLSNLLAHRVLFNEPIGIEKTKAPQGLTLLTEAMIESVEALQGEYLSILRREIESNRGMALETERQAFRKKALETLKDFDPEKLLRTMAPR
jgi:hypothetical protein